MRIIFPVFLFLSSTAVFSDCSLPDGSKLKDGEAKSLFDPGGSLETLKTQDQDGLGTCYANVASVLLKASLPDHPDISYQHAALMGNAYKYYVKNRNFVSRKTLGSNTIVNPDSAYDVNEASSELGFTCDVIEQLKRSGGACEQKYSKIERGSFDDNNNQAAAIKGLGAYFDAVNNSKEDVDEKQLEKDLDSALALIDKSKGKSRKELACTSSVIPFDSASSAMLSDLGQLYQYAADDKDRKALGELMSNMSSSAQVRYNTKTFVVEPNDLLPKESVKNLLAQKLNNSTDLEGFGEIEDLSKRIAAQEAVFDKCQAEARKHLKDKVKSAAAFKKCDDDFSATDTSALNQKRDQLCVPLNKKMSKIMLANFTTGMDDANKTIVTQILSSSVAPACQAAGKQKANLCNDKNVLLSMGQSEFARAAARGQQCSMNVELLTEGLGALIDLGEKIDRGALLTLLKKKAEKDKKRNHDYADQITDILMPECKTNKKPLPESMGCKKEVFCQVRYASAKDQQWYQIVNTKSFWQKVKPEDRANVLANADAHFAKAKRNDDCKAPKEAEKIFAKNALSAIKNQRPIEVSVCADFLMYSAKKDEKGVINKPKSNSCRGFGDDKRAESNHSVTATGYRCNGGKLQYQVLNSWGKKCPADNPGVECEKGKDKICQDIDCNVFEGFPTGRLWVDQDVLVDHSTGLSQITNDEKGGKK